MEPDVRLGVGSFKSAGVSAALLEQSRGCVFAPKPGAALLVKK